MYSKKYGLLFLMLLLTSGCAEVKNTRYNDTGELEMPPVMEIIEKPKRQAQQEKKNTGLADIVSLAGSEEQPVIKLKKMFDRSWSIVEQGLKLSEIEITDKNRDSGVFYLKFDPDARGSKDSGMMDNLSFFLFQDEYEEAAYKLTVVWRESNTEVTVELVDPEDNDLLDDGEDDIEGSIDSGARLIQALYKTIRDDLPND